MVCRSAAGSVSSHNRTLAWLDGQLKLHRVLKYRYCKAPFSGVPVNELDEEWVESASKVPPVSRACRRDSPKCNTDRSIAFLEGGSQVSGLQLYGSTAAPAATGAEGWRSYFGFCQTTSRGFKAMAVPPPAGGGSVETVETWTTEICRITQTGCRSAAGRQKRRAALTVSGGWRLSQSLHCPMADAFESRLPALLSLAVVVSDAAMEAGMGRSVSHGRRAWRLLPRLLLGPH